MNSPDALPKPNPKLANKLKTRAKKQQVQKQLDLPTDRKILDTLYAHYGKPENIVKEKVKLFQEYTTPAGWKRPDWTLGEYQLGRINIYVKSKDDDKYLFGGSPVIPEEGVGSWFVGISSTHIKVWVSGKLDAILEIGDENGNN